MIKEAYYSENVDSVDNIPVKGTPFNLYAD